jgi:hypothetical protein
MMRGRFAARQRTCSQQRATAARRPVAPVLFIELPDGTLKPLRELTLEEIVALAKAGN